MKLFFDSLWRAGVYCFRPRVIGLSLLPLLVLSALSLGLALFFWNDATQALRAWLQGDDAWGSSVKTAAHQGMLWLGLTTLAPLIPPWQQLQNLLAELLLLSLATPVWVILVVAAVSICMTPTMRSYVAARRFKNLIKKNGGGFFSSLWMTLSSSAVAVLCLGLTLPLWVFLPLVMVLPPLIWGWLIYRVMAFDALATHASKEEYKRIVSQHRLPLWLMGILCGYLGSLPTTLWLIGGGWAVVAALILIPITLWLYILVLAFSSLWFTHYCLAALQTHRQSLASQAP